MVTIKKTVLDTLKAVFKKVVPKTTEATRELIWKKFAKNLWKQNLSLMNTQKNMKEMVTAPEKRPETLKKLR